MKKIHVPIIILLVLIIIGFLRWETLASTSSHSELLVWKKDRWTGQTWAKQTSSSGNVEMPIGKDFTYEPSPQGPSIFDSRPALREQAESDSIFDNREYWIQAQYVEWQKSVDTAQENIAKAWDMRTKLTYLWYLMLAGAAIWTVVWNKS